MSNERPLKEKSDDELTSLLWDDDHTWSLHAITSEIDLRMAEKDKEIERLQSSCIKAGEEIKHLRAQITDQADNMVEINVDYILTRR
jgi:hypothetical protein